MNKYKVVIEFEAITYEKALEAFQMMMETFCNTTEVVPGISSFEKQNG